MSLITPAVCLDGAASGDPAPDLRVSGTDLRVRRAYPFREPGRRAGARSDALGWGEARGLHLRLAVDGERDEEEQEGAAEGDGQTHADVDLGDALGDDVGVLREPVVDVVEVVG